ncbi:MAG: MFS transporter [Candidatus Dormibacteria bacterium]
MSVSTASARTFRSLRRHRNFRLYFAGQSISISGTWVQNIAQAWLVVELTHSPVGSPLALGALAAFQFLPYTVFGLLGGPLVDRFDKRLTIVATQTTLMLSAAALAVLSLSGQATVWEVYLLAAVGGAVQVVDTPARQAFVFEMVGRPELPNAVSLNASLFNLARAAGPAVAGVLIATVGVTLCFAINAASFLAVIASLLLMRADELFTTQRDEAQGVLHSLGEGVTWVFRTPAAWLTCALMLVVSTFAINFSVLLPVMATVTLRSGPVVFGILTACFGFGALVGALFTATVGRPSWPLLLGGGGAFSALVMALASLHWVAACAAMLVVTGVAFTTYTSMSNATVQLAAPDRLRGRAMAFYGYIFTGVPAPVGGLLAGWLSSVGGTQLAFLVGGGVSLMAVSAAVLVRRRGVGLLTQPRMRASSQGTSGRATSASGSIMPAPAMAASSSTSDAK